MNEERIFTGSLSGVLSLAAFLLVAAIRAYRIFISPLIGSNCRFDPTCSAYAILAIERHGPARGVLLAGWRLLKCHPFNPGGVDPVQEPSRSP